MATVIQVGEPEEFPPVPRNLPECGNFLPPVMDIIHEPQKSI